ncbi:helix-turn-helix domain-containing protein [Sphingomicrobium aquimarinum]|uniref:helix-turn-helix domain-containing protein n=1 Tax=Sphingomicrobium aquimarinum TaxID=3133971 RepID=UPI003D7456F7
MRSHSNIITDAGNVPALADRFEVSVHTVRSWIGRNRIPAQYWADLVKQGDATFEELATSLPERGAA